jgi:hypothetical protein
MKMEVAGFCETLVTVTTHKLHGDVTQKKII